MDLNFNNKLDVYYEKFVELQEKLKTSEEQRFMLEMKFNDMVHVAKEEEQAHYRKLRAQYKTFLEEDQKRQERNERIIRNLERVEAKISILSAKTERISMFRRQYQKYLKRIANSYPEEKMADSKICRERSFVKEEPLHEFQKTLFRDDYSLPDRPKESQDKENLYYNHPAVKKSLEKDRSNEEKIEILDQYLQSISSQKCRDVLNQERQARENLTLNMPLDKRFHDEFTSNSTNHATAIADDIMNSIYSRYYTKADVTPKENKVGLAKDMQNGNIDKSDYVKNNFKLDDKAYLDSGFTGKPPNDMVEKGKLTVTFKKEENAPQLKDKSKLIKDGVVLEQTHTYDFPKSGESHFQDQNRCDNLPIISERKQANLKMSPAYVSNESNYCNDINNDTEYINDNDVCINPQHSTITGVDIKDVKNMNNYESDVNRVLENDTTLASKIEFNNIGLLNNNPYMNKHFEKNKTAVSPCDLSVRNENYVPQIGANKEQNQQHVLAKNQPRMNDKLEEHQSSEQIFKYEANNSVVEDKIKHQSRELPLQYNSIDQVNPSEKSYYAEEPHQQSTRQLNEHDNQYSNEDYSPYGEIDPSTQNDQLMYNNQDQSSIKYNEHDESGPSIQYNPNNQPPLCDQDEIAQSDQYNPNQLMYTNQDQSSIKYNEHDESGPSIQYHPNNQPPLSDQKEIAQSDQYNPNQRMYNNQDQSSIQYNEHDEGGASKQYNPNNQPPLCDRDEIAQSDQYNPNQLMYNNQDQSSIKYNKHDASGPSIQYNTNSQPPLSNRNEIAKSDQYNPNQLLYNNPDQSSIQYNEHDEGGASKQYNPNNQPSLSDQNEIARSDQYNQNQLMYNNQDEFSIQYNKHDESGPPIQYNPNNQPPLSDQNEIAQSDQYNQNQLMYNNQDESSIQYNKHDESGPPIQYNPNNQPSLSDQNKIAQSDQYNQNQLMYNNQDELSIQYNKHDESVPPIQYNPNNQPLLSDKNEIAQSDQYNPTDPSVLQYDKNLPHEPAQFNEPEQRTEYSENDPSKQQIQYNENEQPIQYDENGQPMGFDQYGQPLMYDQNGQIVQPQYDENGQFMPQYDENGQMIVLYDHNGQQFDNQYKDTTQYDLSGQPVMQYDENGQPIYDQNQQQYYDYPDQYQGDDQGHYIEPQGELNDHKEDTGNQLETEQQNYYQVDDQGPHPVRGGIEIQEGGQYKAAESNQGQYNNTEAKHNIIEENKEVVEINDDAVKPTNVMDILDTDTESAQQNISKISNGSDFDFS